MKASAIIIAAALAAGSCDAGEKVTLVAVGIPSAYAYSSSITLNQGDSAKVLFSNLTTGRIIATIGTVEFEVQANASTASNAFALAGPAIIKIRIGHPDVTEPPSGFVTFEVERAGIASVVID